MSFSQVCSGLCRFSLRAEPQRTRTDPNTGWDRNDNRPIDLQGQQTPGKSQSKPQA
jgi:starvation-inducible DNA-binding protein